MDGWYSGQPKECNSECTLTLVWLNVIEESEV